MGEWSDFGKCVCDKGTCGKCKKIRNKRVKVQCQNGGDCTCTKEQQIEDCSKPCRKITIINFFLKINQPYS